MHHTSPLQDLDLASAPPELESLLSQALAVPSAQIPPAQKRGRGRPVTIHAAHLWFSLLVSVLFGMNSYQDLWRRMCGQMVGPFLPIHVSDDAIVKRLRQAGLDPLQQLFSQVSRHLAQQLAPLVKTDVASFASRIVSLDETTWDAMQRHLASQRDLPDGDAGLLAGKLGARFDIRTQQWDFIQFRASVQANCKVDLCSLLLGLPLGSLLLFDLGYFSFPWFDYLTQMHYWFVCRLREKTTYQLHHVFYRHEGVLDALVWLGSSHGARAGHLVRLVRFYDGRQVRCYLTNVLDPTLLSLADIARLYARRWDIELAFLTLKDQLGLHHWWSSHPQLIQQQILVVLIVAQLVQALRMQIAVQAHLDPFEVSLPLLIEYLPHLLQQREDPLNWVLTHGKALGFIRPASRLHLVVPDIALHQLTFPPPALPLTRKAHYVEYHPRPHRSSKKKKRPPTTVHK
jgi:Transposase DDE domain